MTSSSSKTCYADFTHPSVKDAINLNNFSTFKLALLVAEFAQHMAAAHEHFSKEIQSLISTFRRKNYELKKQRPADTPSTIYKTWDSLLHETEMDAQAHLDAASLLIKNVYKPLEEVATYKQSQAQKLNSFRDTMESMLEKMEDQLECAEKDYLNAYNLYQKSATSTPEDQESAKINLYNAHNEYIFQLRASNRTVDEFRIVIPQILEELEEIYIDTSNTINAAIESHALLLLTKANEQHKRFEDLLKICRQVNPKLDISFFVNALNPECAKIELHYHNFNKPDSSNNTSENSMTNQLISDSGTEINLQNRRAKLQKEASELTSYIKQNQDVTNALVNICQRNLGNHLYSKVYETQEDLCRKRNEIRMGNMKLASIRAQIELLTPKQNGSVENDDQEKSSASIKTMWKKAFKSLKTSSAENKLTKKASFIKKKQRSKEEEAEPEPQHSGDIDPVYSLLKCAADLPKAGKSCGLHPHCSGHHGSLRHSNTSTAVADSSGSTSKTSSPSSSGMQEAVVNSLGSEFKNYYKLTSPMKKSASSPFDFF